MVESLNLWTLKWTESNRSNVIWIEYWLEFFSLNLNFIHVMELLNKMQLGVKIRADPATRCYAPYRVATKILQRFYAFLGHNRFLSSNARFIGLPYYNRFFNYPFPFYNRFSLVYILHIFLIYSRTSIGLFCFQPPFLSPIIRFLGKFQEKHEQDRTFFKVKLYLEE